MTADRCPKDGYALIRGLCPMCDGRRVSDRLPIPSPLPLPKRAEKKRVIRKWGAA